MGATWTTPPQKAWLTERIAAFVAAQKNKRVKEFITDTNHDWFLAYPEIDALFPTAEGESRAPLTPMQEEQLGEAVRVRKDVSGVFTWYLSKTDLTPEANTGVVQLECKAPAEEPCRDEMAQQAGQDWVWSRSCPTGS